MAVNCGAIPENLLESELFGHKKGAFTDAVQDRRGLFEEADGGSLFLDEIGELPLALQVKLLRVLEEEKIRRVGDVRDIKIDTRIITATHRDLLAETKAGRFREDLFYRLNVLPIHVPPLRDRREDIPLLIDHFVARNNIRLGTSIRGLDTESRRLLFEYPWPGNVRELENTIERAMVLAEGDQIVAQDLPDRLREARDPVQMQLASGELSVKKDDAHHRGDLDPPRLAAHEGQSHPRRGSLGNQPPRAFVQDQRLRHHRSLTAHRQNASMSMPKLDWTTS